MMHKSKQFVAALDVGTTKVKCSLVDHSGAIAHRAEAPVELIFARPDHVEIDPNAIWETSCAVIKSVVNDAGLSFNHINCLGISCHRGTFITWNKKTGLPYHRLITWKDRRTTSLAKTLNDSLLMKIVRFVAKVLHFITRKRNFLAASRFKFENSHVIVRLAWVLHEFPHILANSEKDVVAVGTLDTWLLYKFGIDQHLTDYSHASATAMYDPYKMTWLHPFLWWLGIPLSILPKVCDTSGKHFDEVSPEIFGTSIPIRASVADQSASLYGSYCHVKGSLKITMGTGAFLDLNTGKVPPTFTEGFSPLIAWKIGNDTKFVGEKSAADLGSVIDWAVAAGLCYDVHDCTQKATSVPDCDGVFFIPAFSGLWTPFHCATMPCSFIGIKSTTTVPHLLRAVLESLAFTLASLYASYSKISSKPLKGIKVDGGVSNNEFILQKMSNITGTKVTRYDHVERTSLGVAYMAGLANGFWSCITDVITPNNMAHSTIVPDLSEMDTDRANFNKWLEVVYLMRGTSI